MINKRLKTAYEYATVAAYVMRDDPNITRYKLIRLAMRSATFSEDPLAITAKEISNALDISLMDLAGVDKPSGCAKCGHIRPLFEGNLCFECRDA